MDLKKMPMDYPKQIAQRGRTRRSLGTYKPNAIRLDELLLKR